MDNQFNGFEQQFKLNRYPKNTKQTLRAWDAADEYLVEKLNQTNLDKILIFNDSFGAIALTLHTSNPIILTDSIISQKAIEANLKCNQIDSSHLKILNSLDELNGKIDNLIIKIPKSLDYLKYFLSKVRPHLHENSFVIAAGMVKNTPSSVWNLFENHLGKTTTSLAKKKAKLIEIKVEKETIQSNYPKQYQQENSSNIIFNHANVFSKTSLDIGTRFLLENLPRFESIKQAIDLGCGNGIVGLNLAQQYPTAEITFVDESFMAVESARLTADHNLDSIKPHHFIVNNCLDGFQSHQYDLIVCNPPFHQSHAIGLHIALQMFKQSHYCLKKGGSFIVIANRHLPYYSHLKRIFGKATTIASNKKFNLYQMTRN